MPASLGYGADELASLLITTSEKIEIVYGRRWAKCLPYED